MADTVSDLPDDVRDAVALHADGRIEDAIAAYRAILEKRPGECACWSNLGVALRDLDRKQDGLEVLREGLLVCPEFADLNYNLGNALSDAGDLEGALARYQTVLKLAPGYLKAILACGTTLERLKQHDEAHEHYRVALRLHPDSADLYHDLGRMLWNQRNLDAAVAAFRRAIAIGPAPPYFRINLDLALSAQGRYAEGETELRRALKQAPTSADALAALGQNLTSQGRLDEGRKHLEQALSHVGDHLVARLGNARANLLAGDLLKGWEDFGWHRKRHTWQPPNVSGQMWDGEDIPDQSILLYGEQGFGDIIQFARYAPLVRARGARIVLHGPPSLVPLLSRIAGVDGISPSDQPAEQTDWICPLLDLPRIFASDLTNLPNTIPYINVTPGQRRVFPVTQQFRIGIVWAGNPAHERDRERSRTIEDFAPLIEIPGTQFVSFQVGPRAGDIVDAGFSGLVESLCPHLPDFSATADALMEVDLLITVDTAIAHLAGALGRPVWTLLTYAPDWRWMLQRDDTPWYPTMRLFRQPHPNDWAGVFRDIRIALETVISERRRD